MSLVGVLFLPSKFQLWKLVIITDVSFDLLGVKAQHEAVDGVCKEFDEPDHMGIEDDKSENFSDIDDDEV